MTDKEIKGKKKIKKINCSCSKGITDEGIRRIRRIRELKCEYCAYACGSTGDPEEITDKGIKRLRKIRKKNVINAWK